MLLEVGRVVRPHGLSGEVAVELLTTVESRLDPGSCLECGGQVLLVDAARPSPGKPGARGGFWLVRFAGVADRQGAEALRGAALRAEAPTSTGGLFVHELIGSEVVEEDGTPRGSVVSVEANPASDLLVLDSGALVPLHFVVASGGGRVVIDPPRGLFDL